MVQIVSTRELGCSTSDYMDTGEAADGWFFDQPQGLLEKAKKGKAKIRLCEGSVCTPPTKLFSKGVGVSTGAKLW